MHGAQNCVQDQGYANMACADAHVVLEMIELRESDTARAMLRQTQVFQRMKLEDPERYMRLEHLCSRMYFDAREVYQVRRRSSGLEVDTFNFVIFLAGSVPWKIETEHTGSCLSTKENVSVMNPDHIPMPYLTASVTPLVYSLGMFSYLPHPAFAQFLARHRCPLYI
eukprot:1134510-Pelagomonas_calceolata.AAC.2